MPVTGTAIRFVSLRLNPELPRTTLYAAHCIGCVLEQVHDDLLKLYAIACNQRQIVIQFRQQYHAVFLQPAQDQRDHFLRGFVEIDRLGAGRAFAE